MTRSRRLFLHGADMVSDGLFQGWISAPFKPIPKSFGVTVILHICIPLSDKRRDLSHFMDRWPHRMSEKMISTIYQKACSSNFSNRASGYIMSRFLHWKFMLKVRRLEGSSSGIYLCWSVRSVHLMKSIQLA